MLIKKPADIKPSEITPESVYRNRREFMKDSATMAVGAAAFGGAAATALAQNGDQLKASAPEALQRTPPAAWWKAKFDSVKPAPDSAATSVGMSSQNSLLLR